ncbi:MAG: tRNA (adenosine(37)-N6)-threonylcarbamoyltransferase complex transferase subunit TsaD [bacterium]
MRILGIESSCDETAAAVVENGNYLLSNVIASSSDLHVAYGGVVPEIAARSHIEVIMPVINQALADAKCTFKDIDGIAVTNGAGLGGSLLIGVMTARTLAIINNKPLYDINHVLAHVYASFIKQSDIKDINSSKTPTFPMLAVVASGGHTQLMLFKDHFDYQLLGQTQDDAIGEAFDKVAKIIGLPYPGGPNISKLAEKGDPDSYALPIAKMDGYDFSFSGLKTAVLRLAQREAGVSLDFPSTKLSDKLSEAQKANIAASFQHVAIQTIINKAKKAFEEFKPSSVVLAGGVAANSKLRQQLNSSLPVELISPDIKLCTDNAAMIAALGCYKVEHNQPKADPYSLEIAPSLSV